MIAGDNKLTEVASDTHMQTKAPVIRSVPIVYKGIQEVARTMQPGPNHCMTPVAGLASEDKSMQGHVP